MRARTVIIIILLFVLCYLLIPTIPQASCLLERYPAGDWQDCAAAAAISETGSLDNTPAASARSDVTSIDAWWPLFIVSIPLAAWLLLSIRQRLSKPH